MKKMIFLLSVMMFFFTGCGSVDMDEVETQSTLQTEQSEHIEKTELETLTTTEETETEETETEETEETESEVIVTETEVITESEIEPTPTAPDPEPEEPVIQPQPEVTQPEPEPQTTETKEPPAIEMKIEYSAANVVALATEQTKAAGKILLTDNLNNLLANGSITQEEYDSYYPYDGAGYYSVFINTDLNKASTISGRLLKSEEEIAQHIAGMLVLETGSYFLIEYVGTYTNGSGDFYEFRCYRG